MGGVAKIAIAAAATVVVVGTAGLSGRAAVSQAAPTIIKDGKLDLIKLHVAKFPGTASSPVVIRLFASDTASVGLGAAGGKDDAVKAAGQIAKDGPGLLAEAFLVRTQKLNFFSSMGKLDASANPPAQAIVIEGRFKTIDPGDSRKRKLVGMGSGKTATAIEGTVKDASGKLLVEFSQERFGTRSRDSISLLTSDTKSIGEDIANFLDAWARGKSVK